MTQDHVKFEVSWVSCFVEKVGLQLFSELWNHHSIPLKGRPIDLMAQNNKAMPVDQLLSKERSAEHYRTNDKTIDFNEYTWSRPFSLVY